MFYFGHAAIPFTKALVKSILNTACSLDHQAVLPLVKMALLQRLILRPWLVTKATFRSVKFLIATPCLAKTQHAINMCLLCVQVDSFNKHASGKSGNKLMARLPGSKLFGSKKSPRTPSPASSNMVPSPSGNSITLDEMLVYQNVSALPQPMLSSRAHASSCNCYPCHHMQDSIPTSLLKLSADNSSRAVKMFAGIQRYMDEAQEGAPNTTQSIEIVQKLLHQGLKRPELKDELFMQLLKQSRGNPSPLAAGMHPMVYLTGVFNYLYSHSYSVST